MNVEGMEYVINLSESCWTHRYQYEHLEWVLQEPPVLVLGGGVAVEVDADCPLGADAEYWLQLLLSAFGGSISSFAAGARILMNK